MEYGLSDNTVEFVSAPQPLADNNDPRLFKHNHQRKISTDINYESEALAQLKAKYIGANDVPPHD